MAGKDHGEADNDYLLVPVNMLDHEGAEDADHRDTRLQRLFQCAMTGTQEGEVGHSNPGMALCFTWLCRSQSVGV